MFSKLVSKNFTKSFAKPLCVAHFTNNSYSSNSNSSYKPKRRFGNNKIIIDVSGDDTTVKEDSDTKQKVKTNIQAVDSDIGLRKFINKTYTYTGLGIASTLATGMSFLEIPELHPYVLHMLGGGTVFALGGCVGMGIASYSIKQKQIVDKHRNSVSYMYAEDSLARKVSYGAVIAGMGMSTAPIIAIAGATDILLPATVASGLVFGGATWYAYTRKVGELNAWGPALYGGLFGLVGCGLSGIVSTLVFGPNIFGEMMHSIQLYSGLPLFTGLIAYDTHMAIEMYKDKNPDHLGCSLQLYLDFVNVLVRMIEIMAKIKSQYD